VLPQLGGEAVVLRLRARLYGPLLFEVLAAQLADGGVEREPYERARRFRGSA